MSIVVQFGTYALGTLLAILLAGLVLAAVTPPLPSKSDNRKFENKLRRLDLHSERSSCVRVLAFVGTCEPDECSIFETERCSCGKEEVRTTARARIAGIDQELEQLS